jgi:hypothetical protein
MIGMTGIAAYVVNAGDIIMAWVTGCVEGFGSAENVCIVICYDV